MTEPKLMKLSTTTSVEFTSTTDGSIPKAFLDITNIGPSDSNIAYKIKTTAPKLFVVKPI